MLLVDSAFEMGRGIIVIGWRKFVPERMVMLGKQCCCRRHRDLAEFTLCKKAVLERMVVLGNQCIGRRTIFKVGSLCEGIVDGISCSGCCSVGITGEDVKDLQ